MPARPTSDPTRRRAAAAILAAAGALTTAPARAQTSGPAGVGVPAGTVAIEDPTTGLVDQMLALVPVPGGIAGQRPYSTREVVRLATAVRAAAAARPDGDGAARAITIAQALLDAYAPGTPAAPGAVTARPLDFAWAHAVGSGTGPVAFPPNTGIGQIDARALPALDARAGRPAVRGAVGSLETGHALGVGGWLAVVAQPRLSLVARYDGGFASGAAWNVEPQRLFARAVARNVAVQAGVDAWAWGQDGAAGPFLAANARPLRAVLVQSDTAFALPGRLRALGRWRAGAFAADLGRDQNFPHAKLLAYKLTLAARPTVELGAGIMSHVGGRGAPPMSTADRAVDLFPFVTWLRPGSDRLRSNKIAGFDARVRVPRLRGLAVAYELTIDDFDLRRPWSMLSEDSGNLLAVSVPRLARDGSVSLDLAAQRTGLRQFRHYQFVSGVTYRGQVLGAPIGPNAGALRGALTWRPNAFDALVVSLARETRDPSSYANTNPDPDGALVFERVGPRPVERRVRVGAGWERGRAGRGVSSTARFGVERVEGFGYAAGVVLARPFGEGGVRVRF